MSFFAQGFGNGEMSSLADAWAWWISRNARLRVVGDWDREGRRTSIQPVRRLFFPTNADRRRLVAEPSVLLVLCFRSALGLLLPVRSVMQAIPLPFSSCPACGVVPRIKVNQCRAGRSCLAASCSRGTFLHAQHPFKRPFDHRTIRLSSSPALKAFFSLSHAVALAASPPPPAPT